MTEPMLAAIVRLTSAAEALAALAAHLRVVTEGIEVDPDIAALLAQVATELTGTAHVTPTDPAPQSIGMTRAFLREAIALVDDPARVGNWERVDETVLQGVGRISMTIAPVIAVAASQLPGLAAALDTAGAQILDVGTGTGWLAIALARTFPQASITGIDIFEPAMRLARHNVTTEALSDRVSIVGQDITTVDAADQFDAVWLPLPFLPKAIVPTAIASAAKSLRPGGWLLPGTFAGPPDQLGRILTDLRIRRSGGHPWTPDDITTMMTDAGLTEARHVPRTWPAPLELLAAQHPVG